MNFFQFARNQQNQSQNQAQIGQTAPMAGQGSGFGQHQFTGIHFIQKQPQMITQNPQNQQQESNSSSFNFQNQQQQQQTAQTGKNFNFQQNQPENTISNKNTNTTQYGSSFTNPLDALDSIENDLKILSIWTNQQEALLSKLFDDTKKLDESLEQKIQQFN